MDRAGGVYKRKIRVILFLLSLMVAIAANLDTIQIVQSSLANKAQLSQTADKIVSQMPAITKDKGAIDIKTSSGGIQVSQDSTKSPSTNIKQAAQLRDYLQMSSGIACGYADWPAFKQKWQFGKGYYGSFLLALIGVLITAFALQLSSSFWFDLMNKAVNIRAAGKKPDEKNAS
jgi:hypothetical protein